MDYRELFASVKERPAMYGLDGAYRTVVAFVEGCDYGSQRGLLAGFREWLIVKIRGQNSLAWPVLVLRVAFPENSPSYHKALSLEENGIAVSCLFRLLDEFLIERQAYDGLSQIYRRYFDFLDSQ